MKTSRLGVGEIKSLASTHGPKEKNKTQRSQCVIVRCLNPSSSTKPAGFEELVSKTRFCYSFALLCFRVRGCTAAGFFRLKRGESEEKQSSVTFRCWSPRRNELECINLVSWREALYGFSSPDVIMVVGFVLEKHFGGDFTPDQEKEITFKRWPPGYQS